MICISLSKLMIMHTCCMIALLIDQRLLIKEPLYWHQRHHECELWCAKCDYFVCPKVIMVATSWLHHWWNSWYFLEPSFQSWELAKWLEQSSWDRHWWSHGRPWSLVSRYSETYEKCNFILPLKFVSRRSFTFVTTALRHFCNFL